MQDFFYFFFNMQFFPMEVLHALRIAPRLCKLALQFVDAAREALIPRHQRLHPLLKLRESFLKVFQGTPLNSENRHHGFLSSSPAAVNPSASRVSKGVPDPSSAVFA